MKKKTHKPRLVWDGDRYVPEPQKKAPTMFYSLKEHGGQPYVAPKQDTQAPKNK